MAIGVIATIKIKEGTNEAFETAAKGLMAAVRANEPGNEIYRFCKADATTYVVMEIYADQAALDAHRNSDHFKSIGATLGPCMAGRPDIQVLETV
ncbi:MAG: putative quinol monooxygenase [Rhizomicrobium sp.]